MPGRATAITITLLEMERNMSASLAAETPPFHALRRLDTIDGG
jgi:hypothetical protein